MKNLFVGMFFLFLSLGAYSQTIKTYSSCDTNSDDSVTITDVTNAANKVIGKAAVEQNMVTAAQLNTVLGEINAKLDILSTLESRISAATDRLDELEAQMGYEHHDYVDLGLSVKWATCNVGADSPEDYGNYYAWGETVPQSSNEYSFSSYKWMVSGKTTYTYCNKYTFADSQTSACWYSSSTYVGTTVNGVTYKNKKVLDAADDAATANWGNMWRMPTDAEFTELRTNCTWTWTTVNGVAGYKVTGTNGNYIFLPAAGWYYDSSLKNDGTYGYYWSSTIGIYSYQAYDIYFKSSSKSRASIYRNYGMPVRPVCK